MATPPHLPSDRNTVIINRRSHDGSQDTKYVLIDEQMLAPYVRSLSCSGDLMEAEPVGLLRSGLLGTGNFAALYITEAS